MRVTSIVLPVLVFAAITGAFFAGRYIGEYDTEQRYSIAMSTGHATQSAEKLRIVASAADLLRESRPNEALRVLDQYAQIQVPSIIECFKSSSCAWWMAPTAESQETLRRYVTAYGAVGAPKPSR